MLVVIVLGLACTALTFMLYYSLIAQIGEERASLVNYLPPILVLLYCRHSLRETLTIAVASRLALTIEGDRQVPESSTELLTVIC